MAKIEGRERLKRKFQAMPGVVKQEIEKAIRTSAAELVGMQKRLAPVDKGALVNSIRFTIEEGAEFRAIVQAGGTEETRREVRKGSGEFTDEAILAEWGSPEHEAAGKFKGATIPAQKPRKFFFPAYRALRKRIRSRISRSITTGIKKVANS